MNKNLLKSFIAIAILGTIGTVVFLNRKNIRNNNFTTRILGQTTTNLTPTPTLININELFKKSLNKTKETVINSATEKANEVEKTVINTVNKEISSLTQSQLENLKVQICRDLGVISPVPSITPTPKS